MAENSRPPVAIRIVRPYETEDELLENELDTIGKTSVLLIGAHPRPTGVILRFEVTLSSGATLLRGEGRVLAHKENAFRGLAGLSLRFTRLDPRSKALVDRATALREARGATAVPASRPPRPPSHPPSRPDPALADALTAKTPPPPPAAAVADAAPLPPPVVETKPTSERPRASQRPPIELTPPPPPIEMMPTPAPTPVTAVPGDVEDMPTHVDTKASTFDLGPSAVAAPPRADAKTLDAPANKADLLAKLRDRRSKLSPERVAEIRAAKR